MINKHCLFIGHILYGRNNVYEESLLNNLSDKFASMQIVSVNKAKEIPDRDENKRIKILPAFRRPIVDEIVRFFAFLFFGIKWCKKFAKEDRILILLSAPVEINLAALWLQRMFCIKTVNLIIDTALGNIRSNSLWDRYNRACFRKSERLCRKLSASMALNKRVFSYLHLDTKPCLHTKIGHCQQKPSFSYLPACEKKKTIVYTGTLIYYDGTKELLQAMALLDPQRYELHIYGRGPDEQIVRQYQSQYPHIKLMGYLPNKEMKSVMANADLLINPRTDNKMTDIFGFPSKMIEYLLSGTPVLTTRFAAIPDAYLDFVHLIDAQSGEGIANAIEKVFALPDSKREQMCRSAYSYVFEHHSYDRITDEMMTFFDSF